MRRHFAECYLHFATLRASVEFMSGTPHQHGVWTEFRVFRTKDGQSLTDVHNATGLSLGHLSDLENGRRLPTPATLKKIARALNVPMSALERQAYTDAAGNDVALCDLIRAIVREELDARGVAA